MFHEKLTKLSDYREDDKALNWAVQLNQDRAFYTFKDPQSACNMLIKPYDIIWRALDIRSRGHHPQMVDKICKLCYTREGKYLFLNSDILRRILYCFTITEKTSTSLTVAARETIIMLSHVWHASMKPPFLAEELIRQTMLQLAGWTKILHIRMNAIRLAQMGVLKFEKSRTNYKYTIDFDSDNIPNFESTAFADTVAVLDEFDALIVPTALWNPEYMHRIVSYMKKVSMEDFQMPPIAFTLTSAGMSGFIFPAIGCTESPHCLLVPQVVGTPKAHQFCPLPFYGGSVSCLHGLE